MEVSTQNPLFGVAQSRVMESPLHVSCVVPPISANVRVIDEGCCVGGGAGDGGGGAAVGTITDDRGGLVVVCGLGENGGVLVTELAGPAAVELEISGSR